MRRKRYNRPLLVFASGFALSCLCCVLIFCYISDLPRNVMVFAMLFCAFAMLLPQKHEWLALPMISYGLGLAFFLVMQQVAFLPSLKYTDYTGDVQIIVTQAPIAHGTYSAAVGEIRKIGEDKTRFKAHIYFEDASPDDIFAGDVFRGSFEISAAPRDVSRRYVQDEIFLFARQKGYMQRLESQKNSIRFLPVKIAEFVQKSYDETLQPKQAALMRAIVTGDKTHLSIEQRRAVVTSGTSHITAVSGLHVTLLLGLIIALFGSGVGSWAAIPVIIIYVLIVGAPPSAMRAAIMIFFGIGATIFLRKKDTLTAVGGAILVLTLLNPWSLMDIGLQLSFASVLGMVLFLPPMSATILNRFRKRNILHGLARFLLTSIASTISVSIFTLPILCLYFSNVSAVAILGNLLILPVITLVVAMGIIVPIVFYLVNAIIAPFAFLANASLIYVGAVQSEISKIPNATIPAQNIFLIAFAAAALVLGIIFIDKRKGGARLIISSVVVGLSCIMFATIDNAAIVDVAVLNCGGGALLMARQGSEVSAFYSGEFLADSYFSSSQRQLDKWCVTDVGSLMALDARSVEMIDMAGQTWENVLAMKAPEGFNNASFIGDKALTFANDGEEGYPWGGISWKAAGKTYIAEAQFRGGKFLLACRAKAEDVLAHVLQSNIKADYLVIDDAMSEDLESLKKICEQLEITQIIYMQTPFDKDKSLAQAFAGEIKYLGEYDSASYKMLAGKKEIK